ncbi:MAG: hypothetical protein JRI25_30035 [Deltaproteobacteria bacterium]|nr:hypothetical protein [Deltaproteobacteria bacterium]
MSGRRREVPLHDVFQHTRCFLLVDAATHESEQVSAEVPVERESGVVRTFSSGFVRRRFCMRAALRPTSANRSTS